MKYKIIEEYLDEIIPNPVCELNYFNDYSLLISIMLSAQTKDSRVNIVTKILFNKYKSLKELSEANILDLEKIIKPLGSYKKKSFYIKEISNILVNKYNSSVPKDRNIIESLPGVGRKTCNVFLSEYYNEPNFAVDTHVLRVSNRLGLVNSNDPLVVEKKLCKLTKIENYNRRHKQLVLFGRYYCMSKCPKCDCCKIKSICKYK